MTLRLSVWQAFSSNNSARFTVVGIFETPNEAEAAATRLRQLMREIVEWLRLPENNPSGQPWVEVDAGDGPPSPPELAAAQEFGIEWPDQLVDWAWMDEAGNSPVVIIDNLVFVDGTESWMGSYPADRLIERLGGSALVDGVIGVYSEWESTSTDGDVYLELTCVAPDETVAKKIEADYGAYLRESQQNTGVSFVTPWKDFAPRQGLWSYSTFSGSLHRDGQQLSFQRGHFFHIADGFPALLAYLRAHNCTEIVCSFTEERRSFDDA